MPDRLFAESLRRLQAYPIKGDQLGRDEGSVELGGRLQLPRQVSIDLGCRSMFSSSLRSDSWTLRLDHDF